jgi:hypothetical protein
MVRKFVVLLVLTSALAFGQGKPGTGPVGSATKPGPDAGPADDLQMKSIDQVLQDNARLSAKLKEMLPADLTPQRACAGFKTLEQCITAIHLAQNLKLPFADLKAKTTGKGSVGLQKAIEQMAAGSNAKDEVKKAKRQTSDDLKGISLFG